MAIWRAVNKGISTSPRFVTMKEWEQLLFIQMVVQADDFGRLPGDPLHVKLICCPGSPRTIDEIASAIDTLRSPERHLVCLYSGEDGAKVIEIAEWDTTQPKTLIGKRTSSKFAERNGNSDVPASSSKFQEVPAQTETETETESQTETETESRSPTEPLSVSVPEPRRVNPLPGLVFDLYSSICVLAGMTRHAELSAKMKKQILARAKERRKWEGDDTLRSSEIEWWVEYLTAASGSSFLCGEDTGFVANLDYLTGPKNMDKLIAADFWRRKKAAGIDRNAANARAALELMGGDE